MRCPVLSDRRCYNLLQSSGAAVDRGQAGWNLMFYTSRKRFGTLAGAVLCLAIACAASSTAQKHPAKKPDTTKQEAVVQPVVPPKPLTLEQMPATPPQVTYQNGLLTIVAQNSTLGDILRAVHARTGASVDVPANATERVVGRIGPAPARDVIASLLNGSHFNYVMLGSASDGSGIGQLILTPKQMTDTTTAQNATPNQPAFVPPPPQQAAQDPNQDFSQDDTDIGQDVDLTDIQDQTADQSVEDQQQVQPLPQPGIPGVRSPEQLLQELRQQQLQQQQQGTPPQPGNPQQPGVAPPPQ